MTNTVSYPVYLKPILIGTFSLLTLAPTSAVAEKTKENPCDWEESNLTTLRQTAETFSKAESISDAEVRQWSRWVAFKRNKDDEQRCPGNAQATNAVALAALTDRQKDVGPYLKRACSFGIRDPQSIEPPDLDVSRQAFDLKIREGAREAMERLGMPVMGCGKYEAEDPFERFDALRSGR